MLIGVSCAMLTECLEMHPPNGTDESYDTQRYLQLMNQSINFDRWTHHTWDCWLHIIV